MLAIERWFRYYEPVGNQAQRYREIREGARDLADLIVVAVPPCAERTDALRRLREVLWYATAGIQTAELGTVGLRLIP